MSRLLDDTASDAVYAKHVRPELFGGVRRAAAPRLVIVGGQPGCGKTGAVLQAAAELAAAGHGTSIINGDELRALHPAYRRLVDPVSHGKRRCSARPGRRPHTAPR